VADFGDADFLFGGVVGGLDGVGVGCEAEVVVEAVFEAAGEGFVFGSEFPGGELVLGAGGVDGGGDEVAGGVGAGGVGDGEAQGVGGLVGPAPLPGRGGVPVFGDGGEFAGGVRYA
jgi:hypothetical protein